MEITIPPATVGPETAAPNVVSIARHADFKPSGPPADVPPVVRGYFEGGRCFHRAFEVDHFARKVRCRACKVDLDPIDCLHQLTTYDWEYIAAESKRFREEHAALKAEVAKMRAARNALRRKGGAA